MGEIWKVIDGYENYEVSTAGRVRNIATSVVLKPNNCGRYLQVKLSQNSKRKNFLVHRLVASAFIPNPDNKPQVNHINGIKTDNSASNIEWTTPSDNIKHSYLKNLRCPTMGETNGQAKLVESDVLKIRQMSAGFTTQEIAEMWGVSASSIRLILRRKTWKHI